MFMNLRTGVLSLDPAAAKSSADKCGDWIAVDSAKASIRQIESMMVAVNDRSSVLGKELTYQRTQRGIKDNAKAGDGSNYKSCIDVGLAVLCSVPRSGPLSLEEIADCCGCSSETIRKIEHNALNKLRNNPLANEVGMEVFA